MTTTNKADQLWEELALGSASGSPFIYKAYSGAVIPDVYLAVTIPEHRRALALHLHADTIPDLRKWQNLNGIKVEKHPDFSDPGMAWLLVILSEDEHRDVFSVVIDDLINTVAGFKAEKDVVRELLYRFDKWKTLFEKGNTEGLSPEEQQGLFGELSLIREMLNAFPGHEAECISAWIGPESDARDFQLYNWAIEVKTTSFNNYESVQISNERQLDAHLFDYVFLLHLSLQKIRLAGHTLNNLVDEISDMLAGSPSGLSAFRLKLIAGHYFERHRGLYNDTGYELRESAFYQVKDEFPRIEEADLRTGVSNVKYTVTLSGFSEYRIAMEDVFKKIKLYDTKS